MTSRNIASSLSAAELVSDNTTEVANPYAGFADFIRPSLSAPVLEDEMSENINEIASALSKAQGQLESAKKGTEGYGYNYSDLASVISTAKPVLSANGLAVVQLTGNSGDKMKVTTILTHSSGQYFKSVFAMDLVEMKVNIAQRAGATISYMRRYAYQSIIGMSSEDNDASSKGFSSGKKAAPKKTAETKEEPRFKRNTKKEVEDDDGI